MIAVKKPSLGVVSALALAFLWFVATVGLAILLSPRRPLQVSDSSSVSEVPSPQTAIVQSPLVPNRTSIETGADRWEELPCPDTICKQDEEVAHQRQKLLEEYREADPALSAEQRAQLESNQRVWWNALKACDDSDCVLKIYQEISVKLRTLTN
jgi:hypothetical protein